MRIVNSTINLLPDDYLKQRGRRRSNIVCLALFTVVVAGVIGANAVTRRSEARTLEIRDRVYSQYAKAAKDIEHMQALQTQKAVMLKQAELTASLVERMPRSTVLGVISTACPKGISFDEVSLICQVVKAKRDAASSGGRRRRGSRISTVSRTAGKAPKIEVNMMIAGLAETDSQVARFIANLAGCRPLIRDVSLVFSQEKVVGKERGVKDSEGVTVREFEIRLRLAPEADALDMVKTVVDRAKEQLDSEDQGEGEAQTESQETVG